ncbi:MAG TPA: M1 family metallopeptidase [Saprospiraceae bacterium]|nr:M1 family metallopeptidase [Saprospiraceae bacterium]
MKIIFHHLFLLSTLVTLFSCKEKTTTSGESNDNIVTDIHSYAKPEKAVVKHLSLELKADFEIKKLSGTATYQIEVKDGADSISLDTKGLDIQQVTVDGKNTPFSLGKEDPWLGQALSIPVSHGSKNLVIAYSTRPTAEALQWLVPSQTAGKQHPYLFTQGEAILTRTWIPIQDSPGIRLTYDAKITVPADLMAVMSAVSPQEKNKDGVYTFKMDQPIPAYLIALAIGDISFKSIGKRTGVYTEQVLLDAAVYEFADMEKLVETAESLYGPYQWERYDVIVLPPSFPFGGMENPRLTFATPTIIAGDRSLIALIAHELAHSWSGNLVTNATWNDFWLNEGFTVYFERRIIEALYDKSYSDMLAVLGLQDLKGEMEDLPVDDTHLYLNLAGRNPDDGMTGVAYEKGALFLTMLEQKAGREKFDAFLRKYFADHKFQSMTTQKFLTYLDENLIKPNQLTVNVDEWVYKPGLPDSIPVFKAERFIKVDAQVAAFMNGRKAGSLETKEWSTLEWLHFIKALPDSLAEADMTDLDQAFKFTASNNSEIKDAWFKLAIYQGYGAKIMPEIRSFLVNVGRRKFLTPLYTALVEKGMTKDARSIFEEAKPNYHSIATGTIQALLDKAN